LNTQVTLLSQVARPQPRELAKAELKPQTTQYTTPYIEHWVLQLHGVQPALMDDADRFEATLTEVVSQLGLTQVSEHTHYFHPGVSSVIILSESHLSAHTWPELGYMHVDIVTCTPKLTQETLEEAFSAAFSPQFIHFVQLEY